MSDKKNFQVPGIVDRVASDMMVQEKNKEFLEYMRRIAERSKSTLFFGLGMEGDNNLQIMYPPGIGKQELITALAIAAESIAKAPDKTDAGLILPHGRPTATA